ncbi:MAG TPA: hypothetical protein VFQ67_12080 [Allosphingosinicella sp.]|jgi:hypothetical protein|nr:hypothetical protein [Allosphingosinicella sp.]
MRIALIVTVAAFAWAAPALAESNPAKVRLTAGSGKGAILIRVPAQPFSYGLMFSKDGRSGFLSRVHIMQVKAGAQGDVWIARTLAPGRYRLDSMWQQKRWSVCLESGTFEVEVKPGRISYVGRLDTDALLADLQRQAVAAGRTVVVGTAYYLSHNKTSVPPLGGRDEAGTAEARAFAEEGMNGSGELVDLGDVRETSFATSKSGKAIKVCG